MSPQVSLKKFLSQDLNKEIEVVRSLLTPCPGRMPYFFRILIKTGSHQTCFLSSGHKFGYILRVISVKVQ